MVFCQELSILLVDADLITSDLISFIRGTCASPISVLADLILVKLLQTIKLDNVDSRITLKVVMVNNGGSWQRYVKIFEPTDLSWKGSRDFMVIRHTNYFYNTLTKLLFQVDCVRSISGCIFVLFARLFVSFLSIVHVFLHFFLLNLPSRETASNNRAGNF